MTLRITLFSCYL